MRHPGWEILRAELIDFPYGDHDDLMEAVSRAFAALIIQPEEAETLRGGYIVGEN